jgi:T4 RnlA family RNA ligase
MRDLPYSNRIEDYLEAIEGCDAFFVAERDYGRIINYRMMGPDVFPDPDTAPDDRTARLWGLRRQCRGLVFDLEGRVISPGFTKFMNINECEETQAHVIDLSLPHVICAKEDGSMIRPIPMADGGYRLGTKMGLTPVALQPEAWVQTHVEYDRFIQHSLAQGWVPLFEWCSRQQQIVISYPEDRLILLAMRNVADGSDMPLNMMLELAGEYGVEVVRRYSGTVHNMEHLMAETRDLQGQEGWVIWFENGYRVKLKGAEYVTIHRAKDQILRENGVIEMILDEKLDDVKAFLPDHDRHELERYETEFWQGVHDTVGRWQLSYMGVKDRFGADRKGFALEWAPRMEPHLRGAVYKAWDNPEFDFQAYLLDVIRKNLGSQTKVDAVRHLWGDAVWNYRDMGDDE